MKKIRIKQIKKIHQGPIFDVSKTKLCLSNGREVWRETVHHGGSVAIIPVLSRNRIVLVNQYRFPIRQNLWELPAGTLEPNETPLKCAQRELIEETGFRAKKISKIMEFYSCPGFCTEKLHLYLAQELVPAVAQPDQDEDIRSRVFSRTEIVKLLKRNRIKDGKTIVGLIQWL